MFATTESALRGRAKRYGYRIMKSRFRVDHFHNHGEFMLVDDVGRIILGPCFTADLDDIAEFLREAG